MAKMASKNSSKKVATMALEDREASSVGTDEGLLAGTSY